MNEVQLIIRPGETAMRCIICGGPAIIPFWEVGDSVIVECPKCGNYNTDAAIY